MKKIQLLIIIIAAVLGVVLYLGYYSDVLRQAEKKRKSHEEYDFHLALRLFYSYADFELAFSRYVIEKWVHENKVPSAEDTCNYIKTMNLSDEKVSFAGVLSILNRSSVVKIYNKADSLLLVSPHNKLEKINLIHKIKNEEIYVITFLPLKQLLKISNSFDQPQHGMLYTEEEVKEHYLNNYNECLKLIPETRAKALLGLYRNNYSGFMQEWNNTKTLLDFDLFYPKTYPDENSEMPVKSIIACNVSALGFVLNYISKNHDNIEAFVNELQKNGLMEK